MNVIACNPSWANQAQTAIDLDLTLGNGDSFRFTASGQDSEAHGRALWDAAIAGEFGPIAPYEPPKPTAEGQQAVINARLLAVSGMIAPLEDARELDIATETELARLTELKRYRVELSRLPLSEDWPDLVIPDIPE